MARRRLEDAILIGHIIDNKSTAKSQVDGSKVVHVRETSHFDYNNERHFGIFSLRFTADGSQLALGYGDGSIELLSTKNCDVVHELRCPQHHGTMPIMCLRFHAGLPHMCFASSAGGAVVAFNTSDGTYQLIHDVPGSEINCMDFSPDGSTLAMAGSDLDIRLYDLETNAERQIIRGSNDGRSYELQSVGHVRKIFALKFHPDRNAVFVTAGWDDLLKVWDLRTPNCLQRTIRGPHICGDGVDIKDSSILTASWTLKDSLQLWNLESGRLMETIPFGGANGEYLYCCHFAAHNTAVAGGSGTNSVKVIGLPQNHKVLGEIALGHPVQALDVCRGGERFAIGGMGTQVKLVSLKAA